MRIQSIVALTDFSTAGELALDRAALLAAAHQARLHILFGAETPHPRFTDPQARLEQRARQLARRHGLPVQALEHRGGSVAGEALRAAAGADLLVMDRRPPAGMAGLLGGSTLARVLRASSCPVLVVQQPVHGAYAHVLVAVDFSAASDALVRYAGGLEAAAAVELFHAADRRCESTAQALRDYRHEVRRQAQGRRVRLSDVFEARRNRVGMAVGAGDRARQLAVQQESAGADLVALAHRRRGLLGDLLRGRATRRVLDGVGCDVLVYPQDYPGTQARAQSAVARRWTEAT